MTISKKLGKSGALTIPKSVRLEPVHIDSASAKKGMDMRDYAHSFSMNGFNLIIFRKATRAL
ncbi:MAG: hypothetical protein IJ666_05885, partial [Ruminococcus sp.]|nr:hypothetical protein [Ruminococcus sp.]